jgi:hypothetical protein
MSVKHQIIKAILYPSKLNKNKRLYVARVRKTNSLSVKDVCNAFSNKYNTSIRPETMEYYVNLFLEEMGEQLEQGKRINTGYFSATPSVKGAFINDADSFDSDRHKVEFKFSTGHLLRKKAANLKAQILRIEPYNYGFSVILDSFSQSKNDVITPGSVLKITGYKLKLAGDHPDVGFYFINRQTGERLKALPGTIIQNQNARLMVLVPALVPGEYLLEYITQYAGKGKLRVEPICCTMEFPLRVTG